VPISRLHPESDPSGLGCHDRDHHDPDKLIDLLQRPIFASLGTIRPDNTVQVNPMWFDYDGQTVRFTHTTRRAKYRNLQHNPSMSLLLTDPDNPLRYVELRGRLVEIVPDPRAITTSTSAAATATRTRPTAGQGRPRRACDEH